MKMIQKISASLAGVVFCLAVPAQAKKATEAKAPISPNEIEILDLINSKSVPKPLTQGKASPKRGEAVIIARDKGNCLSCHRISAFEQKAKTAPTQYGDMGEIGPPLDGVAKKYKPGQLRLLLIDAKTLFPETMMPSYYKTKGLHRVSKPYQGKTILTAQEIEDILSFLAKLN